MFRIFIGYDSKEIVAYHALVQSILETSSVPVSFVPMALSTLQGIFKRPRNSIESTEFAFSRFLVPYLSGYQGWSLFLDCDMLFRRDVAELIAQCDEHFAVMVCKHDYTPLEDTKFLGQLQTRYQKKNWSSVVLFNNTRCRTLTPDYVNSASGLELHQFKWLGNDDLIGALPLEWNHLVGVYRYREDAANVHFTVGGPYFEAYKDCDYAEEWFSLKGRVNSVGEPDGSR